MFRSKREIPTELSDTASFGQYLDYYTQRVGLTQNRLAACARFSQSRLNKITNGVIKNISVDDLMCLCLVLRLDVAESIDLLTRRERAFSPANPAHKAYLELIRIYAEKSMDYSVSPLELSTILDEADAYLQARNHSPLPNWDK